MGRQEEILGTQRLSVLSWAALCAASPKLHGPQNTAGIYLGGLSQGRDSQAGSRPGEERTKKQKTEELKPEAPGWEGTVRMGPERACPRGRSPAVSPTTWLPLLSR